MALKTVHKIYPSSNVSPEEIAAYGWCFVEDIPTQVNEHGRLAPTSERSELHSTLRAGVDETGHFDYQTADGEIVEGRDFAVAESPSTPRALGFFALK